MNEDDEIAALQAAYGRELPAKIQAIVDAVTARDRGTALQLSHRLRGTAGAYGFSAASDAAGAIEDAFERGDDWPSVDVLTASLRAAAR